MTKPFLILHPSMQKDVERVMALKEITDPEDAQARAILNCVEVRYEGEIGRVDPFQIIKEPKKNLFKYPPDASIRKLMKDWR